MNDAVIGIDIGATKIHVGVIQNSKVVKETIFPTQAKAAKEVIITDLIRGIEKIAPKSCSGIGIGVPGLVDEEQGIIYDLWNIPSWKEVHLKEQLQDYFEIPVEITNDANTFALGEKTFGQGRNFKNIVGITLGSGFGTGIVINNKLYSGSLSSAGELADIPYLDSNIEDYCSGKFFRQIYGREGRELFALAKKDDTEAIKIFREFGKHLGKALKIIYSVLSPEAVFFGGSISKSFKYFEAGLQEQIDSFPFKRVTKSLVIAPSETANISLLGAAALIEQNRKMGTFLAS